MRVEITIKEAVIKAQNGENDAMIALLKKYQPIIAKGIGKAIAMGINTEDLDSIFTLTLISMIKNLDISKLK